MNPSTNRVHLITDDIEETYGNDERSHIMRNGTVMHENSIDLFTRAKHLRNGDCEVRDRRISNYASQSSVTMDTWRQRFQKYSDLLLQTGASALDQEAVQLRKRLLMIQNKTFVGNSLSQSDKSPELCKQQRNLAERNTPNSTNIGEENKLCRKSLEAGTMSKVIVNPLSVQNEPLQEKSSTHNLEQTSTSSRLDKRKRKYDDGDKSGLQGISSCKEARISNSNENQQLKRCNPTSHSNQFDVAVDENEESKYLHPKFEQNDVERAYLRYRAERMKKMADLLRHLDRLQQSFLMEITDCCNDKEPQR